MKKKITISVLLIILIIVGVYNVYKPLPKGISMEGSIFEVPDSSVKFLYDLTYINSDSEYVSDQVIFDEVFSMIQNSENFILLDMFLFNDFMGSEDIVYKQISSDLVNELVNAKINNPELEILVLTDPLNTIYGAIESDNFNRLKEYDIMVVETNLRRLRDSNPVYSSLWRSFLRFLPLDFIKLPNPFDSNGQRVSIRAYFELLNFKANHRKLIIADYVDNIGELKVASLITSANPHDGSSRHSNVAVRIDDFVWRDILKSELATLAFSSEYKFEINKDLYQDNQGDVFVQLLTERQIKNSLINSIDLTSEGDSVNILMFYLSDRDVINSIKRAHKRGVDIKLLLDANKDAFGREKNGVPNVSVAKELRRLDSEFNVRWCHTNGEQCHSKMIIIEREDIHYLFIGSTNLTRRNLNDLNLETNIKIFGTSVNAINDAAELFNNLWNNTPYEYSLDYEHYADESWLKYFLYLFMEWSGFSTF